MSPTSTANSKPTTLTSQSTSDSNVTTSISTVRPTGPPSNGTTEPLPVPTQSPPIVCPAMPCPLESVCLNGTCQCLSGSFLLQGRCRQGQVFAGLLHITSLTFNNEMRNRSSQIFQNTAANITATLRDALKNQHGYIRSDVIQLVPGSVQATVNNLFEDSNVSQEAINTAITDAIVDATKDCGDCLLANATFRSMYRYFSLPGQAK
ncbi:uncharacterized protein FYW47_011275 [Aplochiton taeniatus]